MPRSVHVFAIFLATVLLARAEEIPRWAYLLPPATTTGAVPAKDDGQPRHVPGSTIALTSAQIAAHGPAVPDWHPDEHPAMPEIVNRGREPAVWACAFCHLPSGAGRPENASLAGLTPAYIRLQLANFQNGDRPGAETRRAPQNHMIALAKALTDAEAEQAAAYFAALKPASFIKVVESPVVPVTYVAGAMLARLPDGGEEPIGNRIIEIPEDLARAENRDSHTTYVAYVPPGSIARGAAWVATGGGDPTKICASCHGPEWKGLGDVPRLAGRSPSYLMRQLYDIQTGARTGSAALMKPVAATLAPEDMVAIAAFLASRDP